MSGKLAKYEAKVEAMRSSALAKVQANRASVRKGIDAAEVIAGAALAGYADAKMPTVGGVPTSAAGGLLLLGLGIGMKQQDIAAIGLGMVAGKAYQYGAVAAAS